MDELFISKKTQNVDRTVASIKPSASYITVETDEQMIMAILKTLYFQEAWKDSSKDKGLVVRKQIVDKEAAFDYNIKNKLPAPYYIEKRKYRKLENAKYTYYAKK